METFFTPDNWNRCQYRHENQFAIISILAQPSDGDTQMMYCVTVMDDDNNEIFQSQHESLLEACQKINNNYAEIWEFRDLSLNQSSGGCSTCQAH